MKNLIRAAAIGLAATAVALPALAAQTGSPVLGAPNGTQWAKPYHFFTAGTTNSTLIGAGTPTLLWVTSNNPNGAIYLKIYDKATAPVCGTDTPVATIEIGAAAVGFKRFVGLSTTKGLGFCVTGALADSDTTTVTANSQLDFFWK